MGFFLFFLRAQKFFRKLMDVDPSKRLLLCELPKYTEDKWLKKVSNTNKAAGGLHSADTKWLSDGISQLTMGSFQSVHSNAVEKNRILFTLLQHGVETTVDRTQKNSRIINWIQHGQTAGSSSLSPPASAVERGAAINSSASAANLNAAAAAEAATHSTSRSSFSDVLESTSKSN